jgi:hypothetical protein
MEKDEFEMYEKLPNDLTVYRGCNSIEAEIDEAINEARNAVYSFNMITALYSLNKIKHML